MLQSSSKFRSSTPETLHFPPSSPKDSSFPFPNTRFSGSTVNEEIVLRSPPHRHTSRYYTKAQVQEAGRYRDVDGRPRPVRPIRRIHPPSPPSPPPPPTRLARDPSKLRPRSPFTKPDPISPPPFFPLSRLHVLPTISQDLTEGQQHIRDQTLATLAHKLGSATNETGSPLRFPIPPLIPKQRGDLYAEFAQTYRQDDAQQQQLQKDDSSDDDQTRPRVHRYHYSEDSGVPIGSNKSYTVVVDTADQDTNASSHNYRPLGRIPPKNQQIPLKDQSIDSPRNFGQKRFGDSHFSDMSGSCTDLGAGREYWERRSPLQTTGSALEDLSDDNKSSSGDLKIGAVERLEVGMRDSGKARALSDHKKCTKKSREFHMGTAIDPANIDWRSHICAMLGADEYTQDSALLRQIQAGAPAADPNSWTPSACYTTLHEVVCKMNEDSAFYEDSPDFFDPRSEGTHIRGQVVVKNLELYIERHPGLSFIVYKSYTCCSEGDRTKPQIARKPTPSKESVEIISFHLIKALNQVAESSANRYMYPIFEREHLLYAPYPWVFHDRPFLVSCIPSLDPKCQTQLRCFLEDYISQQMAREYVEVEALLSQGFISVNYIPYLFVPGEIMLQKDQKKTSLYDWAFTQLSWPVEQRVDDSEESEGGSEAHQTVSLALQGEFWEFDGKFFTEKREIILKHDAVKGKPFPIKNLSVFPLRFAGVRKATKLKERGEKLWGCRHKKLMCYTGWDFTQNDHFENARVMIDRHTYNKMHNSGTVKRSINELDADDMARDQPPSEDFLLLLPPNTFGYFMRERKWHNIMIENMSEVCWDKDAFKSLVMDSSTKELIMALVTSQIEPSQATELMSNKGNGLIILLHGGPGTGKTLTAESVAEYTKKPLYRITSGDIGTTPSEVEKYLDVVLDLGRRWDCVVLLDEAEVFLQARTLTDLARNSLVSVFLRVLEYFQGILILTSNRVATFDEAFKSRIQLALYYEPLGRTQRKKVWQNFINRLEKVAGSAVDTDDLHENVDKLAEVNMNGRQIRNAMTTARQLAMFRKQRMDFETLNYIIGVSQKFDKYLSQVNEGMTDEELARDEGVR